MIKHVRHNFPTFIQSIQIMSRNCVKHLLYMAECSVKVSVLFEKVICLDFGAWTFNHLSRHPPTPTQGIYSCSQNCSQLSFTCDKPRKELQQAALKIPQVK